MAFASTVTKVSVSGNRRRAFGTFTNAATDSGGDIKTGLKFVEFFEASYTTHLGTEVPKVTLNSGTAGTVAIVTSDGADGIWQASGL